MFTKRFVILKVFLSINCLIPSKCFCLCFLFILRLYLRFIIRKQGTRTHFHSGIICRTLTMVTSSIFDILLTKIFTRTTAGPSIVFDVHFCFWFVCLCVFVWFVCGRLYCIYSFVSTGFLFCFVSTRVHNK